jgi:hypothetical protein
MQTSATLRKTTQGKRRTRNDDEKKLGGVKPPLRHEKSKG